MATRRAKDPLSAATTGILVPALQPHGFRRGSTRRLGRLGACAFQLLELQKSASGSADFCVNYASMLLVPPVDHLVLQPGGRLRGARGGDAWWPAAGPDQADESMRQVVAAVRAQALPFFQATRSAGGLYDQLAREEWGSRHHLELALGACAAWLEDLGSARAHLGRAIALYAGDGRSWCAGFSARAQALLDAIDGGVHGALLRGWRAESVQALGLGELEDASPAP